MTTTTTTKTTTKTMIRSLFVVSLVLSLLLFISSSSYDAGAASAAGSGAAVVDLTASTYGDKVARGTWFIKFYAPWCGHCKRLAPVWEEFAGSSSAAKLKVNVAHVNCHEHSSICIQNEVQGYPTLMLFKDGKKLGEYRQGSRTLASMNQYLTDMLESRKSDGQVHELTTSTFDQETMKPLERHMIMFYAPWCPHCQTLKPVWTDLAREFKGSDVHVDMVDCDKEQKLCAQFSVAGYPTLKFVHWDKVYNYAEERSLATLVKFIKTESYKQQTDPLVRTPLGREMGLLEQLASNPQYLIIAMVAMVVVVIALMASIMCCCIDDTTDHHDDIGHLRHLQEKQQKNSAAALRKKSTTQQPAGLAEQHQLLQVSSSDTTTHQDENSAKSATTDSSAAIRKRLDADKAPIE